MKTIKIQNRNFHIYVSSAEIEREIKRLASILNNDMRASPPLFLSVLNGSFMFAADLLKEITIPCRISFVKMASYEGTQSTGKITRLFGLNENIEGQHVIILEDIIDTGLTIKFLIDELQKHRPASIRIATLLFKREALQANINPDFIGFEVPQKFLVGYGLDYNGYGRNLRHIYEEVEELS